MKIQTFWGVGRRRKYQQNKQHTQTWSWLYVSQLLLHMWPALVWLIYPSSFPSRYQLQTVSWLGVNSAHFPFLVSLCRSCVCCSILCAFVCQPLCLQDAVTLVVITTVVADISTLLPHTSVMLLSFFVLRVVFLIAFLCVS